MSPTRRRAAVRRDVKVEPEPETTGAAARQAVEAMPEVKKPKTTQAQHRTRPARQLPPGEATHYAQQPYAQQPYAQQPSFGGYQPMY